MYTRKIQRLYIGLRESKTFESRGKLVGYSISLWDFNYYNSGRSKAINVLSMVLHFVFIFLLKNKELCF